MKFTRNDIFAIAKKKYALGGDKSNCDIQYSKWVDFIDSHPEDFIWYENTKDGIEILQNINKVPENFRNRTLKGLNKYSCFKEFDVKKGYYNINLGFDDINNLVSIGFERTPRLEDLNIFVEMAKHLDALLLKDGKIVIDDKVIADLK